MSSRLRAHSWQAALPKPLPAEQGFDASEARLTRVRWVKGGFRGVAPQASALARLRHSPNRGQRRLHSSTRTSATFRDSRASQRFRIQGCGVVPSNSIERNWEESRDQSRFGWPFGPFGRGAGGGTETRIAAGANEA